MRIDGIDNAHEIARAINDGEFHIALRLLIAIGHTGL